MAHQVGDTVQVANEFGLAIAIDVEAWRRSAKVVIDQQSTVFSLCARQQEITGGAPLLTIEAGNGIFLSDRLATEQTIIGCPYVGDPTVWPRIKVVGVR